MESECLSYNHIPDETIMREWPKQTRIIGMLQTKQEVGVQGPQPRMPKTTMGTKETNL